MIIIARLRQLWLTASLVALGGTFAGMTHGETTAPQPEQPVSLETRVDTVVARHMAARHIPGLSLGVVQNGMLVLAKGYGQATLEWKAPATPDTVYLLASLTKQFTATAIMTLVGDGRVRLDEPIAKYVTAPPAWAAITVRQLLAHTAGLQDRFEHTPDRRLFLDYSKAQMLEAASRTPTDYAPGSAWQYSDQGYFLLGMAIERASGQTYGEFLRQRIFGPAGMTSTTLHDWKAIVPGRADGYTLVGQTRVASRRRYQFELVSHYGVQSTVRDLALFDAALSAGTVLPAKTLDEMWSPARLADGRPAGLAGVAYGFGWFLERFRGHREVYHGGSTGTCLYRLPDDGVSVILLTNLEQEAGSDPCGIARLVAAQLVPAIALEGVAPIDDPDQARTTRLRRALDAFVRGTPDATDFTPAAFAVIGPLARVQHASFAALGPMSSFALIASDALAVPVLWYRATYRAATVHYRFVLDSGGQIASLQAR